MVMAKVRGAWSRPEMRRRVLVLADQAASALSNALVAILVARGTGVSAFGAFSLAVVASQLVLSGIRSVVGEPLLSLYSHEAPEVRRRLMVDIHGTTLFLGAVASVVLWLIAAVLGGLSGSALMALAFVLPLMLFQDAWRFAFIVDRPGAALIVDLVWLVGEVAVLPLAPARAGVAWYVVVWGLTGGLGGLVGAVLGGRLPGRPHPWQWLVHHRETSWRFFTEFVTARASSQLVLAALGAISGLAALGAANASFVYYGVLNTLHTGIYLAVVPEGARKRDQPARLRRLLALVSGALVVVAVAWMLVGLVLPDSIGRQLFGDTWDDASELMVPMGLAMILGGVSSGGLLGLRSLGDARRSLRARFQSTAWQVVCPLTGAFAGAAGGFAFGFVLARAVAAAIWWKAFGQALRDAARGVRARLAQSLDLPEVPPVVAGSGVPVGGDVVG
jgi:hypothetical protein